MKYELFSRDVSNSNLETARERTRGSEKASSRLHYNYVLGGVVALSPSEEKEEDNRVAVIKYERWRSERGERGLPPSFPNSRWREGTNRHGARDRKMPAPAKALLFRFNK